MKSLINLNKLDKFLICLSSLSALYFVGLLFFGPISFSGFWLAMAGGIIVFITFKNKLSDEQKRKYRITLNTFYTLLIVGITAFCTLLGIIIYNGEISEESKDVNCVIVLGAGLKGDKITLTLYERLKTAVEYLEKNENIKVIVSGGQGEGEDISEAQAMEKFLIEKSIDKKRIVKEENSTNTSENFKYTREKLNSLGFSHYKKVLVVTNSFHIYRSKILAHRNGFIAYGLPANTHPALKPNFYVREVFAVVKSYLFD